MKCEKNDTICAPRKPRAPKSASSRMSQQLNEYHQNSIPYLADHKRTILTEENKILPRK